jgi:hypothetical protein
VEAQNNALEESLLPDVMLNVDTVYSMHMDTKPFSSVLTINNKMSLYSVKTKGFPLFSQKDIHFQSPQYYLDFEGKYRK